MMDVDANNLPGINMAGVQALYAYGYPYYWSANTGRERSNTATMLTVKDTEQFPYIMYILDKPWDGSGEPTGPGQRLLASLLPQSSFAPPGRPAAQRLIEFECLRQAATWI